MNRHRESQLKALRGKADALHGCLAHVRTVQGRRLRGADGEDPLGVSSPFISDEAKLLCSKAFRLLEHKTQVATLPQNPLIRNRKTHTLEVVACAVIAADMLGLNIDLARAIAVGHDIGHTPFGHQGEAFLKEMLGRKEFCHEVMGPIIAQKIERRGRGLNLTHETLEGMMCHSGNTAHDAMTPEAWVIRYVDKFSYIFADYNDVILRIRFPVPKELQMLMDEFGASQRERTTTALAGLVIESSEYNRVSFQHSEFAMKFKRLRELMYELYPRVTQQNTRRALEPLLEYLSELKIGDPFLLLALMTDRDAVFLASQHMKNATHLQQTALSELLPYLDDIGHIDLCDAGLDW